jgi:hypothetical protein
MVFFSANSLLICSLAFHRLGQNFWRELVINSLPLIPVFSRPKITDGTIEFGPTGAFSNREDQEEGPNEFSFVKLTGDDSFGRNDRTREAARKFEYVQKTVTREGVKFSPIISQGGHEMFIVESAYLVIVRIRSDAIHLPLAAQLKLSIMNRYRGEMETSEEPPLGDLGICSICQRYLG